MEGRASAIPVTEKGDVLGVPAGVERSHPRLRKSYEKDPNPERDGTAMQLLIVNDNGRNDEEDVGVEVDEELGDAEEERKYAAGGIQDESKQGSRDGLRNYQVDYAGRADS